MTDTHTTPRRRARTIARVGLALYLVLLAWAVLSPSNTDQSSILLGLYEQLRSIGAPERLAPMMEELANVAIVVPLGLLGALSFPGLRWQDWAAYAFLGALTVELVQGVLLPVREMAASDVVANTLGAVLGAALVAFPRDGRPRRGGTSA